MRYILTTEQMIENDYPIPSYIADVFEKPPGWVETAAPAPDSLSQSNERPPRIFAIDCEMVCIAVFVFPYDAKPIPSA